MKYALIFRFKHENVSTFGANSMNKISLSYDVCIPSEGVSIYLSSPHLGPKVVLISGGNGASSLAEALKNYTHNSKHIVTMYDDGGSSRGIRDAFNMPPPGDLRNLILHMADFSHTSSSKIAEVLAHRISKTEYIPDNLQKELDSFIYYSNSKMLPVEKGFGNIISLYLSCFDKEKPKDFNLRGASIGNLVMAGCYLLHGQNIENSAFLLSELVNARGTAIPVTLGNYYLSAELEDGNIIYGQANITNKSDRYMAAIKRLFFVEGRANSTREIQVTTNERAISALKNADAIIYSFGSFFTSILCTLMTPGIADAIRESRAPKIFLANAIADDETRNISLSHMFKKMASLCIATSSTRASFTDFVQYVIANQHGNTSIYRGVRDYIPVDRENIAELGVNLLEYPLEKARGKFDTDLISRIILSFVHP